MTGDLIRTEEFQGISVRVVQHDQQAMVPLNDIADALKIDRSGLHKLHKRHMATLGKYTCMVKMSMQGEQARGTVCLTHPGFIGIVTKVKPGACDDPGIEDRIILFQQWGFETLSGIVKGDTTAVPSRLLSDDVREALKVARIIHEETGVSLPIAQSFALEKVGAGDWQKLLPAATMPTGYLTPTDIGNRVGYTARQVNLWLYNNKLQIQDSEIGDWRLTEAGKQHAEEFPFTKNNHSGYQIKWRNSILPLMNVHGPGQAVLSSG